MPEFDHIEAKLGRFRVERIGDMLMLRMFRRVVLHSLHMCTSSVAERSFSCWASRNALRERALPRSQLCMICVCQCLSVSVGGSALCLFSRLVSIDSFQRRVLLHVAALSRFISLLRRASVWVRGSRPAGSSSSWPSLVRRSSSTPEPGMRGWDVTAGSHGRWGDNPEGREPVGLSPVLLSSHRGPNEPTSWRVGGGHACMRVCRWRCRVRPNACIQQRIHGGRIHGMSSDRKGRLSGGEGATVVSGRASGFSGHMQWNVYVALGRSTRVGGFARNLLLAICGLLWVPGKGRWRHKRCAQQSAPDLKSGEQRRHNPQQSG